jgi:hypothetical protein
MATEAVSPQTYIAASQENGRGRGLFARRDFAAGQVIATFNRPVIALGGSNAKASCNWCLRVEGPLKPCSGCHAAVYCCQRCQRSHWKHVHKWECKAFQMRQISSATSLPTSTLAVMQLLLREKGGDADVTAAFGPQGSLNGNLDKFRDDDQTWNDCLLQCKIAIHCAGLADTQSLLDHAVELICKVLHSQETLSGFDVPSLT